LLVDVVEHRAERQQPRQSPDDLPRAEVLKARRTDKLFDSLVVAAR
jgi:hypothetical protein